MEDQAPPEYNSVRSQTPDRPTRKRGRSSGRQRGRNKESSPSSSKATGTPKEPTIWSPRDLRRTRTSNRAQSIILEQP